MTPQQLPFFTIEAVRIATTMRASFKTADVAGYLGWPM